MISFVANIFIIFTSERCSLRAKLKWSWLKLDKNIFVAEQKRTSFKSLQWCRWCCHDRECSKELCHGYLHFNHRETLPDANARSTSKWNVGERDNGSSIGLQEPLRLEFFWFREVLWIVVHCMEREIDEGAFFNFVRSNFTIFWANTVQPRKNNFCLSSNIY